MWRSDARFNCPWPIAGAQHKGMFPALPAGSPSFSMRRKKRDDDSEDEDWIEHAFQKGLLGERHLPVDDTFSPIDAFVGVARHYLAIPTPSEVRLWTALEMGKGNVLDPEISPEEDPASFFQRVVHVASRFENSAPEIFKQIHGQQPTLLIFMRGLPEHLRLSAEARLGTLRTQSTKTSTQARKILKSVMASWENASMNLPSESPQFSRADMKAFAPDPSQYQHPARGGDKGSQALHGGGKR